MSAYVPPRPDLLSAEVMPAKATWRWWEALIAALLAWLAGALASLPLVIILKPDAAGPIGGDGLFIGIVSNAVTLGVLILWLRTAHPRWVEIIGWPEWSGVVRELAIGAGLGILVRIAAGIVGTGVVLVLRDASDRPVNLPTQISTDLTGWGLVAFAIFAVIAAPVLEEFVFRGLLFRSIADRHGLLGRRDRLRGRVRRFPSVDAGERSRRPRPRDHPCGHRARPRVDLLEAEEPPRQHRGACHLQSDRRGRHHRRAGGLDVPEFPTEEWFQAFIEAIDASEEYGEYAATWEGDVIIQVEAEPDKGLAADVHGLLDLWHGGCRGGGIVDEARAATAEFVVRAPYSRWKDVIHGDLEPIKGLVQGKLRVRGDLPKILRYVKGTQELAYIAGQVDTTFPDES